MGVTDNKSEDRPVSESNEPSLDDRPSLADHSGSQNRPSSSSSQRSVISNNLNRPGSGSSQKSVNSQRNTNRAGSAGSHRSNNAVTGPASGARPGSAGPASGSRPGSEARPGSAASVPGSRPGSASSVPGSRPSSAASVPGSRPGSASSVPGSRPGSVGSRPGSSGLRSRLADSVPIQIDVNNNVKSSPNRRVSNVTVLDIEESAGRQDVKFAPKLDEFPTMPPADNLFVIEEEESEEMLSIEVISKDMGQPAADIEPPEDWVNVPKLLDDLHSIPTQLASEEPAKDLFTDKRIPEGVEQQLEVVNKYDYLDDFDMEAREDVLMIGNISLEEIKSEEQRLRAEHVRFQDQEARLQVQRQETVLKQTEHAKHEVKGLALKKRKELREKEKQIAAKRRQYHSEVQTAFRKAQSQLMFAVQERKAEIETMFGDLILADSQYGGNSGRRWKVDWNRAPQPIQLKLRCLRGIKDKLPGGRYVVLVSMYDRIGGHVMRWSNLTGQQWSGSTLPLNHQGAFHDLQLPIEQSVFTVCPATPDIRPSMVFVYEVFLLRGPIVPTDRVVAWGAFPLCDKECSVIEGRYKCPLLRGEVDNRVQSYDKIERLIATDLDNWLCNLYFEVTKLPRYMGGQKEFEVELQFTSSLLGYPDRLQDTEPPADGNPPLLHGSDSGSVIGYEPAIADNSTTEEEESGVEGSIATANGDMRLGSAGSVAGQLAGAGQMARPFTAAHELMSIQEEEAEYDADADYENEFSEVQGESGLYYKVHREHPMQTYHSSLYKMLPRTDLMQKRQSTKKTLTSAEELAEHKFAIHVPFCEQGKRKKITHERFRFLYLQILTEVGVSKFRTPEFWTLIFFLFVTGLGRMLLHYTGQYILLQIWDARVTSFTPKWYTCELIYFSETLNYFKIIALVMMGPMTNVMVFTLFVTVAAVSYRITGYFPNIASQFISAFGVMTFLDWFLVLVIDCICGRYERSSAVGMEGIVGDAFKLYEIFDRKENNGLVGAFLTVFIYFFVSFLSGVIFYMYYLRIHLNGRLLDIFVRLTGKQGDFFLPQDLEISHAELDYTITKAEQWRGEEGERRKTAIYDYVWEEEVAGEEEWDDTVSRDVNKHRMEITTHVSIHTLHLDGLRELYRHFLRLADGTILEVFGEAGYLGLDEAVKSQLADKFDDMEVQVNKTLNRATLSRHRTLATSRASLLSRPSHLGSARIEVPVARPASRESGVSRASLHSRASVRTLERAGSVRSKGSYSSSVKREKTM